MNSETSCDTKKPSRKLDFENLSQISLHESIGLNDSLQSIFDNDSGSPFDNDLPLPQWVENLESSMDSMDSRDFSDILLKKFYPFCQKNVYPNDPSASEKNHYANHGIKWFKSKKVKKRYFSKSVDLHKLSNINNENSYGPKPVYHSKIKLNIEEIVEKRQENSLYYKQSTYSPKSSTETNTHCIKNLHMHSLNLDRSALHDLEQYFYKPVKIMFIAFFLIFLPIFFLILFLKN
jgi:hypothetical protein